MGRACNSSCQPLGLCDQKPQSVVRAQISGIWRTGYLLPTWAPESCVQAAAGTRSCSAVVLRVGIGPTAVYCLGLLWKLQIFSRLPGSKIVISDQLCHCRSGSQIAGASYSAVFPESYSRTSLLKPCALPCLFLFLSPLLFLAV